MQRRRVDYSDRTVPAGNGNACQQVIYCVGNVTTSVRPNFGPGRLSAEIFWPKFGRYFIGTLFLLSAIRPKQVFSAKRVIFGRYVVISANVSGKIIVSHQLLSSKMLCFWHVLMRKASFCQNYLFRSCIGFGRISALSFRPNIVIGRNEKNLVSVEH